MLCEIDSKMLKEDIEACKSSIEDYENRKAAGIARSNKIARSMFDRLIHQLSFNPEITAMPLIK